MIDVSIIIVNYNTMEVTTNCINSIFEKTSGVSFEIVLVDNASTDGSKERFESDRRIKYIYSKRNGGFGYGNNLGMRHACGKYLFLLNSDTLLINNAVKEFYDYAETHAPDTVYGCYLKGPEGENRVSFFPLPAFTFGAFFKRLFELRKSLPVDYQDRDVEVITGADMFIPRTVMDKVGGFNENIFLYGEETELQYRMMRKGVNRRVIHSPQIIHLEGVSSGGNKSKIPKYLESHFIMLKTHMPYWKYLVARVYYFTNLAFKSLVHRTWLNTFTGRITTDPTLNAPDVSYVKERKGTRA